MKKVIKTQDDFTDYLLATEVGSILGVSSDVVWRLARNHIVRTTRGHTNTGRPCYLFCESDVMAYKKKADQPPGDWISRDEAATILGLHPNSMCHLARFEKVTSSVIFTPGVRGNQHPIVYLRKDVEDMQKTLDTMPDIDDYTGGYIAGLIDGEGSFSISVRTEGTRTSYETALKITLRNDDIEVLVWLRDVLGFGRIYGNKANGRNPAADFSVSNYAGMSKIVRLLEKYPLHAKKAKDLEIVKQFMEERNKPDRDEKRLIELQRQLSEGRKYIPPSQELVDKALAGNVELNKKRIRGLGLVHK